MPGRTLAQGPRADEDYTGYEKDEETQLLYAGARYYMPALGRFGTTDRFADKYPALSPYNYAANDPATLIDVNGDSLWVQDGDDRILYTAGMEYDGDSEFISKTVSTLNTIGSVETGSEVLSTLIESENDYNLLNQEPPSKNLPESAKAMQFSENQRGGVDISAGALMDMSEESGIESTAHELFHGYQREVSQDPGTAFSEVGAYLYGPSIRVQAMGGIVSFSGTGGESGSAYTVSMTQLFYESNFNRQAYERASNNFQEGSLVGHFYPNHPTGPIPTDPAISVFYPLAP